MTTASDELSADALRVTEQTTPDGTRHRHRAPAGRRRMWLAAAVVALVGLLIGIPVLTNRLGDRRHDRNDLATATPRAEPTQPGTSGAGHGALLGSPATAPPPPAAVPSPTAAARSSAPAAAAVPVTPGASTVPAPVPPPVRATYAAVAGEGCPGGSFTRNGTYTAGSTGWYRKSAGGWTGDGCTGAYWAVPMSGDPAHDESGSSVTWTFHTGPVATGDCQIGVFVPTGNSPQDVAGKPAWYRVTGGRTFTVDQVANRGSWVSAGSVPVTAGTLTITLLTRGSDPQNEHLAAAQTRVSCRTR